MPVCNANGISMYYEWSGREYGPVLIFSNSLGTRLEMWQPQVEHFSGRYRILRYDARGHGRSEVPPGPYTIETMGHDVLALAAALHVDRAAFCGLSMGGVVGQWLGAHAPQLIAQVVLCNTAARIGTHESWNERIAAVEAHGMQALAAGVIPRWFTQAFVDREPQTAVEFQRMLLATSPAGYAASCAAIRDADMHRDLAAIKMPTLVVYGEHDPVTTPKDAEILARHIQGARLAGLPTAHLSNVEAAKQFNEHLEKFLEQEAPAHE